ncbi:MAG: Lon-like protease helical domain-containing protein [Planctomycetota bacterium]
MTGTGRSTLLRGLLESIRPDCPKAPDRCYVHNFDHPDRPRLLTLPRGRGEAFRSRIENLVDFIRKDLAPALSSDVMRSQTEELDAAAARDMEAITGPFNEELKAAGLTLVTVQIGTMTRPMILPLEGDEPVPPERIEELRREGKITEEAYATLQDASG